MNELKIESFQETLASHRRTKMLMSIAMSFGVVVQLSLMASIISWKRLASRQQEQNEALLLQLRAADDNVVMLSDDCERLRIENDALRGIAKNTWGRAWNEP